MFLGLPDPHTDPLVKDLDPNLAPDQALNPDPAPNPDPSIIKQKK